MMRFVGVPLDRISDRLDDRGRHYLDRIRAGARRMSELIDDLLATP